MSSHGGGGGGGEGEKMEIRKEKVVLMWGFLPGSSPQRLPLLSPAVVHLPQPVGGDSWKDVSGGGCGFAMAISESGKLITWGSTDDLGQSYLTSGKHEETPEPFPLPTEASIVKAAAGWAHCVVATAKTGGDNDFPAGNWKHVHTSIMASSQALYLVGVGLHRYGSGEVYTWGWKECVPSGKIIGDQSAGGSLEKDLLERQSGLISEQVSPRSQLSRSSGTPSSNEIRGGEESAKRRRLSSAKQDPESSTSSDEMLSALPCLVSLSTGVKIVTVAAGGRHTLALSDVGQVWGWGYGGEGQLGLGSRIRMVSSPHPVPCFEIPGYGKDRSLVVARGSINSEGQTYKVPGNYVKAIACGGRHSAVITDAGVVLAFGWGLYGQCGQGSTDDELSPTCVSSLWGIKIQGIAAGLWHTVCISVDGSVYAFGGNQFGQLGTGADQAETLPRLLDAPSLENKHARIVSCGARHSAIVTDDGKVFCWGWNKYGQLGLGDVIDRSIPIQVPIDGSLPKNVSCGWWHTLVLAESPT